MSIEIVPTAAALGVEIRGVNLARPIDDETFASIERAYNDHGVIFFRDQLITPPRQVAFTRRFGEIELLPTPQFLTLARVLEDQDQRYQRLARQLLASGGRSAAGNCQEMAIPTLFLPSENS